MKAAREQTERETPVLERPEVKEQLARARVALGEIDTRARRVVQDKPLVAVGVALALGYALGRSLRPRAMLAIAGLGARLATVAALDGVVGDQLRQWAARGERSS